MYPLLLAVVIALLALTVNGQSPRPCQPPVPLTVSRDQNIFTEEQEADLGDVIAEQIQHHYRVIDDEAITTYLNRIGQRIIKHLPPTSLRFRFLVVDLPEANAFVLPGGRVYVSRKLVALAQSEDEVAGLIGHEIGHVLARQGSTRLTRQFREVLGVTEVKDRRDIYEKYNQLLDNAARKPKAFVRGRDSVEKDQVVADQIGLFAVASAGYDPYGHPNLFDRITENKGDTGSFLSELFGTTKPQAKRLREMIKGAASLPPSCIDTRAAIPAEEFQRWQVSVTNYTGPGRKESLHAVVKKLSLEPPLRSDITHIRFSPNGKYVLTQDDSGIDVLSVEPFAPLFRVEAPEAKPAQFTPDSQNIVFYNSTLRVQVWSLSEQKLKAAHDLLKAEHNVVVTTRGLEMRKGCIQTQLSPDAKIMACLDSELSLDLIDVASGAQVFQKNSFYKLGPREHAWLKSLTAAGGELSDEVELINMGFSPDGRYFAAGARKDVNEIGYLEGSSIAVDLTTRESVDLPKVVKRLLAVGFAFLAPDRLIGKDESDPNPNKSLLVSFPSGKVLDHIPVGRGWPTAPTRGNYLLVRPIVDYPLGVIDLSTKTVVMAHKTSALDIYDQMFVSERNNGELGLYGTHKRDLRAKVILPRNMLGNLRGIALSPDMRWLAISERSRGAVWDLTKGERVYHVRGFREGHFADDGAFYAEFPKLEKTERTIARFDLTRRDVSPGFEIKEERGLQFASFLISMKPATKDGGYQKNVVFEVRDIRTFSLLWSKTFPEEAPKVWATGVPGPTLSFVWPLSSEAAKAEIRSDAALTRQLAAMNEKEGDYFLQVVDARTGKPMGRLLIETGKGSFRIKRLFAVDDWVAICDTQNRVSLYSLSTGEQKGKVFGSHAMISPASKLLCVQNESGQLTVYDLTSMEKRDQFTFSSPVSMARFSQDGKSLFVLTANQTAYLLDLSSLTR